MIPLLFLVLPAFAQQAEASSAINAQLFRPTIDSRTMLWVDESGPATDRYFSTRLLFDAAHQPFVLPGGSGAREVVIEDLYQLDLLAGYTWEWMRVGVDVPMVLRSVDRGSGSESALGDVAGDVRASILDARRDPLGLALSARVTLPTASSTAALGTDGPTWEVDGIVDKQVGGFLVAVNAGYRWLPSETLDSIVWDDALVVRLGAGWAWHEAAGVSLELGGQGVIGDFSNTAGRPLEGLLGGWYRIGRGDWVLRAGAGKGLNDAVGAPAWRALASIGYEPPHRRDNDGDGRADREDDCPDRAEDIDGWQDDDGCPEPTLVRVRVLDSAGTILGTASSRLLGVDGGPDHDFEGTLDVELPDGTYRLESEADGYLPLQVEVEVAGGIPMLVQKAFLPDRGSLKVEVRSRIGSLVDGRVRIDGGAWTSVEEGRLTLGLVPGVHEVRVEANGFRTRSLPAEVMLSQTTELPVVLESSQVRLTEERIEISDTIYFELAKAVIKPASFVLLDDVATALLDHPEITRLRIEGHTDSRGSAAYNLSLSDARALAVREYLVAKGVDEERLTAVGFGEERPVDPAESESAWAKNRRVDFFIEARSDP